MTMVDGRTHTGRVMQQIEYLDLDGDGLPDAVRTIETLGVEIDGVVQTIEQIETLEAQIGVDGVPRDVSVIASPV
jgi:hypothetical protein